MRTVCRGCAMHDVRGIDVDQGDMTMAGAGRIRLVYFPPTWSGIEHLVLRGGRRTSGIRREITVAYAVPTADCGIEPSIRRSVIRWRVVWWAAAALLAVIPCELGQEVAVGR